MTKPNLLILFGLLLIGFVSLGIRSALAKPDLAPVPQASALHPTFALLDKNGENVLTSNNSVSTIQTCGQCHDTEFIQSHAFHSDLGLSDYEQNGSFNASTGTFGKWNPLNYRFLSHQDDERLDLGTPEWLMLYGNRIVGGGPAETSRNGTPLDELASSPDNPETAILESDGTIVSWDWQFATMEMNCFLCHLEDPNLQTRADFISFGAFDRANTATLDGTGIVTRLVPDGGLVYNPEAFDDNGLLKENVIKIQDPTNTNCAACHGEVHTGASPLTLHAGDLNYPLTATTGQVMSSQKISESGVNLSSKSQLNRSWDIHAERQLLCTDCHYSLNNPTHAGEAQSADPNHLLYDPRTLEIGEYLERPDHNFARGQSAQYNAAPELKGTMRRCESCHDASKGHSDWLPYIDKHMATVACETCHIPQMYAPAIQFYDWTVLTLDKQPVKSYRGVEGDPNLVTSLVTGYTPVLLNRTNIHGQILLAPYNLITAYYWIYDDANGNKRPVRLFDLEAAFFGGENSYAADILLAFDADKDGRLSGHELLIDSAEKEEVIKSKLEALGVANPRIEGLIQPYSINHNVTRGEHAINKCTACHSSRSRAFLPIQLASYAPNGVLPVFDRANNVNASGEIMEGNNGEIYYNPIPTNDNMYLFGSSRVRWIDWLGALMFTGTILGVAGHGTLRFVLSRKQDRRPVQTERIYMYESYRRFWHWLQTTSIIILLFTGLVIHRPDIFGAFSFRGVVLIHNVIAVILVVNALLSVFYHIATERVREYVPRPYGFLDDAILQAKYYLTGIFKKEPHPFEKRPDNRMNPIQKATYFSILNVLLPLQMATGTLMWGMQEFPQIANWFGGLPILAPLHSLVAWTFATFIVGHVYMTTTGATPLEAMRAMVTGYEEVEVHREHASEKAETRSDPQVAPAEVQEVEASLEPALQLMASTNTRPFAQRDQEK